MKKIFLVLCLGIIGFSRISSAARKTGEEITKVKQNAEKIESEKSVDKAEEVKQAADAMADKAAEKTSEMMNKVGEKVDAVKEAVESK